MQVLGWGSEVDFVTSASRFGHQVLCSDYTTNVPVFSNFGLSPQELLPHRPSRRPPSRLTSRLSHITPPTTAPVNGSAASPAIGHGTTPKTAPALAARLAARHNINIVPAFVERLGLARYRIVVQPALERPQDTTSQALARYLADQIDERVEAWVRPRIENWYWLPYFESDLPCPMDRNAKPSSKSA